MQGIVQVMALYAWLLLWLMLTICVREGFLLLRELMSDEEAEAR